MRSRPDEFTMRHSALENTMIDLGPDERPYRIIRNSWGNGYGDHGEGYAAMGIQYAGLESGQALHIRADPSYGLLKKKYAEPVKDSAGRVLVEKVTPVSFPPALEEDDLHVAEEVAAPPKHSILEDFMNYIHSSAVETASSYEDDEASVVAPDGSQRPPAISSVRVHEPTKSTKMILKLQ